MKHLGQSTWDFVWRSFVGTAYAVSLGMLAIAALKSCTPTPCQGTLFLLSFPRVRSFCRSYSLRINLDLNSENHRGCFREQEGACFPALLITLQLSYVSSLNSFSFCWTPVLNFSLRVPFSQCLAPRLSPLMFPWPRPMTPTVVPHFLLACPATLFLTLQPSVVLGWARLKSPGSGWASLGLGPLKS